MKAPLKKPCATCPYRRDVPSGVWAPEEYAKLPRYDLPTPEQPTGAFGCHQANGHLCSGWAAVHDMDECLSLRLAVSLQWMSQQDYEATLDYATDVPLYSSGKEAFIAGMAHVGDPSPEAQQAQQVLIRKWRRDLA
jgi:hypothetical protein